MLYDTTWLKIKNDDQDPCINKLNKKKNIQLRC